MMGSMTGISISCPPLHDLKQGLCGVLYNGLNNAYVALYVIIHPLNPVTS